MSFQRRMRALVPSELRLTDPFWARYFHTLRTVTLPHLYDQCEETGRLANFRRAAGTESGDYTGLLFNDSDVYKVIEATAYVLGQTEDAALRHRMEHAIAAIAAAQESSGYLNTYLQLRHPDHKWANLHTLHEMYCGGHLIEAAVAVARYAGDSRLLQTAERWIAHVMKVFGPNARLGYCGHEELELALVRLAEFTSNEAYRDYARWMVDVRGSRPSPLDESLYSEAAAAVNPWYRPGSRVGKAYEGEYAQDHAPVREHTSVVGHAVRAMYLYAAAADLADGREDVAMQAALRATWDSLTKRRMYITGGLGASAQNEGFTSDYDLPNLTAYAETCAACGLIFWGQRMLELTGQADFADVIERALYNGALAGIAVSGDRFFYANPLESRGTHERVPFFECACCPPNIARLLGQVGSYVAGIADDAFYLHIPAALEADVTISGVEVRITVESRYPWSGEVKVTVSPERPVRFALHVRIPNWSEDAQFNLIDRNEEADFADGYVVYDREWQAEDRLEIDFEMTPRWVEADPKVRENLGRTALTMGPLIYCAEAHDLGYAPQLFTADPEAEIGVEYRRDLLGGTNVLHVPGIYDVEVFVDELYAPLGTVDVREETGTFIPYFAWNNRGKTQMQVWVRRL